MLFFSLGSVYFVWGPRRFSVEIVLYNPFSWHLLLWFLCFCWGSETLSELHVCFALLELLPFWEPLQALTVFTKRIFFWRLVSWRFLVCVNSEIFQLQRHFYWIFFFTVGFNGVVLKVFVNPCLFPWVCHARLFCFFKLQNVSLWYSCSDSLNSFLDNTLISQRCPILRGLLFTARKLWLALLFRKTCRRLLFGFFVEP